jgi:hypothetical protein
MERVREVGECGMAVSDMFVVVRFDIEIRERILMQMGISMYNNGFETILVCS